MRTFSSRRASGCCEATALDAVHCVSWKLAVGSEKKMTKQSELEAFAEVLVRHGVEFIVIGGQAELLMGSPRVTYDTDLCYCRTSENLAKLAAALKEIKPTPRGAPPDLPIQLDVQSLALGSNYTFDTPLGPLDLLGWVEPLGNYEALLPGSESFRIGNLELITIGLDDLITIKQHIGRSKDRESLLQLLAIREIRRNKSNK